MQLTAMFLASSIHRRAHVGGEGDTKVNKEV